MSERTDILAAEYATDAPTIVRKWREAAGFASIDELALHTHYRAAYWHAVEAGEHPVKRTYLPRLQSAIRYAVNRRAHRDRAALEAACKRSEKLAAHNARLKGLDERGAAIARLVWNQAEDIEFLDMALGDALLDPGDGTQVIRYEGYLVRVVLTQLAEELRVVFPERQWMEARADA